MIREEHKSAMGHICTGGGATIDNSPIHVHFHIYTNNQTVGQKIARAIDGFINRDRHYTIEGAMHLTGRELQGQLIQRSED